MTESGGPTTQAGINYQNSIAVLYLGDLLNLHDDESPRIVSVRVEAPSHVDDIVVKYADGRSDYLQVKLAVRFNSREWNKLWQDISAQYYDPVFQLGDRVCLTIRNSSRLVIHLQECARRTISSNEEEWRSRLTREHEAIVVNVENLIGRSAFLVFRNLDVKVITEEQIGGSWALERIPVSNIPKVSLFAMLVGIVSSGASRRELYYASELRNRLSVDYFVSIEAPACWGLRAYLEALLTVAITVPGTSVGGLSETAFVWPRVAQTDCASDFDDEQLDRWFEPVITEVNLRVFPAPQLSQCIIHAGPGFGKSALLIAISDKIAREGSYVPATVPLASLAHSDCEMLEYLEEVLNAENSVSIGWRHLCEIGSSVILMDGLDEVALVQRAQVMQKVERFVRRFPSVPWILTVRDTAVLPAGFNARKLELLPLVASEMAAFVSAIRPSLDSVSIARLIEQATAYPDLQRLLRIPLFLALMVATWNPLEKIPEKRSELIETYLKTLFRPEEHKVVARACDPERLRAAMQSLAYKLIDTGEIGTSERIVRKLLAEYVGQVTTAEALFDDALRCGILRRSSSTRLVFPFPVVQEYLASEELFEKYHHKIPEYAARAHERPWAQTVQFALEKLSDSSEIATTMLESLDDAFSTGVRLLARCILNGMSCSNEVKERVGVKLALVWHRQSFWTSRRIGQLLNDGWSELPHEELRRALHRRSVLCEGAGEILAKINDDELTLSVLRGYLENPQYLGHLGEFQLAVDRVSKEAFQLYIEVVRSGRWNDEIWAAAALIGRLDPAKIPSSDIEYIFYDGNLPVGVRLAAFGLAEGIPAEDFWPLAIEALSQPCESDRWAAIRALRRLPLVEDQVNMLFRNMELPAEAHYSLLDNLNDVLPDRIFQIEFLKAQWRCEELSEELRARIYIRAASYGNREAFDYLLDSMSLLSIEHIKRVLNSISEFPCRDVGRRLIESLRGRDFLPGEKVDLVNSLLMGVTYKFEDPTYESGGLVPIAPHPSYADVVSLISEWREEDGFEISEKLKMETIAVRVRLPGAGESLHRLSTIIARNCDTRGHENPLNYGIRSAMEELAHSRLFLALEVAIYLAENTDSNAEIGALNHIGAIGSREALNYLIVRSSERDDNYSTVFQEIEGVAGRLNLKIVENQSGLSLV